MSLLPPRVTVGGFFCRVEILVQPRVTVGASGGPWSFPVEAVLTMSVKNSVSAESYRVSLGGPWSLPVETVLTMSVSAECAGSG